MCWVGSKERCGRDSVEWFVLTHGFELILSVGEGCMSPLLYVKAAPEPPPPGASLSLLFSEPSKAPSSVHRPSRWLFSGSPVFSPLI